MRQRRTHWESLRGWPVCVQFCDYRFTDGTYCNEYLGINYPDSFCEEHRQLGREHCV